MTHRAPPELPPPNRHSFLAPLSYVEINGKQCILKKIFVQVKFTFGIPSVQYIIISGVDPDSGAAVEEKTQQ